MLELLTLLCWYPYWTTTEEGHTLVWNSISGDDPSLCHVKRRKCFEFLLELLRFDPSLKLQIQTLKLINSLIMVPKDLNRRVAIRSEFLDCGLLERVKMIEEKIEKFHQQQQSGVETMEPQKDAKKAEARLLGEEDEEDVDKSQEAESAVSGGPKFQRSATQRFFGMAKTMNLRTTKLSEQLRKIEEGESWKQLDMQSKTFLDQMAADQKGTTFQNIDYSNPEMVFQRIRLVTAEAGFDVQFLDILKVLSLIPKD
eukprot:TRINITY_DN22563_c0_g1_i1.p1 TRINITY_DN22563_c0_g1~~TRINITY_DN22563_c0_g1_i1.p1  ORF type:complete len:255 (-),score=30.57 TRINITY_DN22563_c0_g1_i1:80-844(-)